MNPLIQIEAYIALAVGIFLAGLYEGYEYEKERCQAASDKAQAQAFEEYKASTEKVSELSAQLAATKAKTNTVYKTITNTVEKTIHEKPILSTTVCLDDSGMRLFNADIKQPSADTGKSIDALRTTSAN